MAGERFALFDFDDTLCRGDSIVPYLLFCIRKGIAPKSQLFKAACAFLRQIGHPERASGAKTVSLSFIKGHSQREMDEFARAFFREVLIPRFFAEGQKEIVRLKNEGYHVLIISASADVYMRVLPEFMPVEAVMSTKCEVDSDGCYTGKVCENCKGSVKPVRLREYLEQNSMVMDGDASCAYGDSPSDAPMLMLTGRPNLVSPSKKLIAKLPDARIVHWR